MCDQVNHWYEACFSCGRVSMIWDLEGLWSRNKYWKKKQRILLLHTCRFKDGTSAYKKNRQVEHRELWKQSSQGHLTIINCNTSRLVILVYIEHQPEQTGLHNQVWGPEARVVSSVAVWAPGIISICSSWRATGLICLIGCYHSLSNDSWPKNDKLACVCFGWSWFASVGWRSVTSSYQAPIDTSPIELAFQFWRTSGC